jgi:6,7-dimethyl-8-ribityllumazine synthase
VSSDIDHSTENVLAGWRAGESGERSDPAAEDEESRTDEPTSVHDEAEEDEEHEQGVWGTAVAQTEVRDEPEVAEEPEPEEAEPAEPETEEAEPAEPEPGESEVPEPEFPDTGSSEAIAVELSHEHAAGDLDIPDGYAVLEGDADGSRRAVGVVVARFNGGVTSRLLKCALDELDTAGVRREAITVMVVPGAFELPLAATALAKTRRFACIVALGCVIRGDTPHFDYVAGESASGLQLAALETGVPVSFGVLTLDRIEQADARVEKGAEAVRTALEMADVFAHLRAAASR